MDCHRRLAGACAFPLTVCAHVVHAVSQHGRNVPKALGSGTACHIGARGSDGGSESADDVGTERITNATNGQASVAAEKQRRHPVTLRVHNGGGAIGVFHQIPCGVGNMGHEFFHVAFVGHQDEHWVLGMPRFQFVQPSDRLVVGRVTCQPPDRVGGVQNDPALAEDLDCTSGVFVPRFRGLAGEAHVTNGVARAKLRQRFRRAPADHPERRLGTVCL